MDKAETYNLRSVRQVLMRR